MENDGSLELVSVVLEWGSINVCVFDIPPSKSQLAKI